MPVSPDKSRVLIIDDERLIADTLTQILKMHGFEATPLYSGESALEWIETYQPDIVLSDIVMHRLDGVEAAARIRKLHPECRIILFSASALSPANRRKINHLGLEFLERPLHPRDLLARVIGTRPQIANPLSSEQSKAS
jgi:DNA-binding response OmpR family regulator